MGFLVSSLNSAQRQGVQVQNLRNTKLDFLEVGHMIGQSSLRLVQLQQPHDVIKALSLGNLLLITKLTKPFRSLRINSKIKLSNISHENRLLILYCVILAKFQFFLCLFLLYSAFVSSVKIVLYSVTLNTYTHLGFEDAKEEVSKVTAFKLAE